MMTESRREALEVLAQLAFLAPDVRLGQLMAHLGFLGVVRWNHGLGDLDDDELVAVLHRHRDELVNRLRNQPRPTNIPQTLSQLYPDVANLLEPTRQLS